MIRILFILLLSWITVAFLLNDSVYLASISKAKDKEEDKKEEESKKEKQPKKEINEAEFQVVSLGNLLNSPQSYIGKKIKFQGEFSSFTTLALDYKPALRDSKEYISITIFRPETSIPLSELKMAYPVKEAKENEVVKSLEKGDLLEIYGEVFSAALDEPWLDIHLLKKIKSAKPKAEEKIVKAEEKIVETDDTKGDKDKKAKDKKKKK